ncbi:hypothetical protein D1872_260760 [compost metagenome]
MQQLPIRLLILQYRLPDSLAASGVIDHITTRIGLQHFPDQGAIRLLLLWKSPLALLDIQRIRSTHALDGECIDPLTVRDLNPLHQAFEQAQLLFSLLCIHI